MLAHAPQLTLSEAQALAAELFAVAGAASPLPSERDQNVLITRSSGERFVRKIANAAETPAMLEAENAVLVHLSELGLTPRLIPTEGGTPMARSGAHFVRLITALPGRPLAHVRHRSEALLTDLGRAMATIDDRLASFDHPAVHRTFYWDLAGAPEAIRTGLERVADPRLRASLAQILTIAETTVTPRRARLRHGVIHGDANDHNVLVDASGRSVTGLVDFGDMVVSDVVNDLAIAMAYVALGEADPVGSAAAVARGYHATRELSADELGALFGLVLLRLGLSVAVAARQQAEQPGNAYLGVSQEAIRATLPRLLAVHPRLAEYRFRDACGLPPVPASARVIAWLRAHGRRAAAISDLDLRTERIYAVDLSVGSPLVSGDRRQNAPDRLSGRLEAAMTEAGATVGVGGYGEARLIYPVVGLSSDEQRTVHLGVDLTMAPGTRLYAPLAGRVHGFELAAAPFDYGPVVVLRHDASDAAGPLTFYTLYGHLDRASLDNLAVGQAVAAGTPLGRVGAPPENGGWWPHLHLQVITDMLDVPCNFNGVAAPRESRTWLSLCPDPNLLLGIPATRLPAPHPTTDALIAERALRMGSNVRLSYAASPLQIVRGAQQYLYDEAGRQYLDAYNNVPHVGHAHPRVTRAVASQLATLNTNTRYLHETVLAYAIALASTLPDPLSVCFFTASGSEANELALRMARAATGRRDLIVFEGAYHGHTTTLIDVSPYKHDGPGGEGPPDWVHATPVPDVYRGPYRDPAQAGAEYGAEVATLLARLDGQGRKLCGFLAETCPSVGGQIILPAGYLAAVYAKVRQAGGLCIADEVQTGLGRLGTHFWAFEAHGVVPDIVVVGKPIANGYPMGAVITTPAIADAFDTGMEFFSTFGGSTAACAAALATLQVTIEERLQAHAAAVGQHLVRGLRELQSRHERIGDVRGSGLFLGVELVNDRETREPAALEAATLVTRLRQRRILTGTDGPLHNVLKIRGPMPFSIADADRLVSVLDESFD